MAGLDAFDRAMDFAEDMVDAVAGKKRPRAAAPSSSSSINASRTALTADVRIIEAIDSETNELVFVVQHGNERAECSSREFAEHIQRALRATP